MRAGKLPLRVLIVAHGHPELNPGGGEFAAYLLFCGLRRTPGVEPHFLAWAAVAPERPSGRVSAFASRRDESVIATRAFDSFLLSQPSAGVLAEFKRFLARIDPDVVHFHHYTNLGIEFVTAARQTQPDARLVVTFHEYLAICHHYGTMVKTAGFALCAAAGDKACAACFPSIPANDFARRRHHLQSHFAVVDRFVAPSEFLRRRYVDWGIPAERVSVLANGIDPAAPRRRPHRAGERRAVFGFFGQIHPFKGLLELLDAFDRLEWLRPAPAAPIRLVIHGAYLEANHPDYVARFRDLLAKTAARVEFRGPYRRRDLDRLMAAVDWVIVPSIWWENAPLVIEEALARRRPVVCSDIGGMAERVRPGRDGFHFPAGNAAALAGLLNWLGGNDAVWEALQATMRPAATIAETVAGHLEIYRDRPAGTG
jgi:glycosyltransferase involved in cell wall biosynthesis